MSVGVGECRKEDRQAVLDLRQHLFKSLVQLYQAGFLLPAAGGTGEEAIEVFGAQPVSHHGGTLA